MSCIEVNQLSHHYSRAEQVLKEVSLKVPEGSIYGFLGPNGAGKTTTLRLILGLLRQQSGEINILGQPFARHREDLLRKIGSLIENPSVYAQLTAAENLRVWQKIYQCPSSRIQEVLDLVGLGHTGKKKAGQFSLGMKQRLGLAAALLHQPSILVLDEPTNGLDPGGIVEMRELLKTLNRELGISILVSSHLLSEVEKLATHVGIIHLGQMLFEGTLDDLKKRQQQSSSIQFETGDSAKALQIIQSQQAAAKLENGHVSVPSHDKALIAELNRQLVQAGIPVYKIQPAENDLETIFMNLTK
jgi:lantibiotic transport system ATP-binding protein